MQASVELQSAFIIHSRNYRETSQLVDFITPEYGRVRAVAKGVKRNKSYRNLLHPFSRILISWYGKGELKTLRAVDQAGPAESLVLRGNALFSGMYVNELLSILFKVHDHSERIFNGYRQVLMLLANAKEIQPGLRAFEKLLLEELGYGIPFPEYIGADDRKIDLSVSDTRYYYSEEGEFIILSDLPSEGQLKRCFSANELESIRLDQYQTKEVLQAAKRLMRLSITPLLGGRSLRSRELFRIKD